LALLGRSSRDSGRRAWTLTDDLENVTKKYEETCDANDANGVYFGGRGFWSGVVSGVAWHSSKGTTVRFQTGG